MLRDLFSLFPAYAGVIPIMDGVKKGNLAFPRIRGGDPKTTRRMPLYSVLFPAYAGVIPVSSLLWVLPYTFPRIRGGDPEQKRAKQYKEPFSPHTRG